MPLGLKRMAGPRDSTKLGRLESRHEGKGEVISGLVECGNGQLIDPANGISQGMIALCSTRIAPYYYLAWYCIRSTVKVCAYFCLFELIHDGVVCRVGIFPLHTACLGTAITAILVC